MVLLQAKHLALQALEPQICGGQGDYTSQVSRWAKLQVTQAAHMLWMYFCVIHAMVMFLERYNRFVCIQLKSFDSEM